MTNFIEEFYYGNIDPQARSFEQNKKVQHDMQTLTDNEDFLTDKLTGEEKKRFIQYVDAWASVNGESTLDSFITGFRLGAQFAFDTFVTSKTPYVNIPAHFEPPVRSLRATVPENGSHMLEVYSTVLLT